MHRFFITDTDVLEKDSLVVLDPDLINQISRVFRSKIGDEFVFIHDGKEYLGELVETGKINLKFKIENLKCGGRELDKKIRLYFPLLKSAEKIEYILQKCTEIGVFEFVPIITARTERDILPKVARLKKIITEAAEQSGRVCLPELNEPVLLRDLNFEKNSTTIILDPNADNSLIEVDLGSEINIVIGPEGGFNAEEVTLINQAGAVACSMGKLIYRAETACVVACGIVANR